MTTKELGIHISSLPLSLQKEVLHTALNLIDNRQKQEWFRMVCYSLYPESRWEKIEQWMERHFVKDSSRTPRQVAVMCMNYMRIDTRMKPMVIKLAQKVKARVVMRQRRK